VREKEKEKEGKKDGAKKRKFDFIDYHF